jgi:hypothetical protein
MDTVRGSEALTKAEFHRRLQVWLVETDDATIGEGEHGRNGWVHVRDGNHLFKLNSDCTRAAVKHYLDLVSLYGNDLEWKPTSSQLGNLTAVLLGPKSERYKPFYLYVVEAGS